MLSESFESDRAKRSGAALWVSRSQIDFEIDFDCGEFLAILDAAFTPSQTHTNPEELLSERAFSLGGTLTARVCG